MTATALRLSTQQKSTWPPRLPGILLSVALATVAAWLGTLVPVVGGPVFGIVVGMLVKATGKVPSSLKPGIALCSKQVLQAAIVLFGLGLSLTQVVTTGVSSLAVMLTTMVTCLTMAWLLGRLLGVPAQLTTLVGVGTAICGASAIAAISPVIEAEERDVAYSISTIFAFNVVAVLLFPFLGHLIGLNSHSFGLWAGTAVNDTSSVVAAAFSYSKQAGDYATIVKLARSTLIIPIALLLAGVRAARARKAGARLGQVNVSKLIPWFIVWFLVATLVNTSGILGTQVISWGTTTGKFLIVVALTAVGLAADFRQMAKTGFKPILLGLALWVTVAVTSLLVQHLTGQLM